jgi:NAD(P)-dependent dehydrogenase (short-subunit alcohol dehydrogenase family)
MMRNVKFNFENKVVLITGGEGAIGTALADAFLDSGATVYTADHAKNESNKSKRNYVQMDVRVPDSITEGVHYILARSKKINILITAAGQQIRKPALEFEYDEWDQVIKTNLYGSFFVAQEVAKVMLKNKLSRIIFITSLTSEIGLPNMVPYVASRGGIKQMSKALAVEWASKGITVNCIGPGRLKTPMTEDVFSDPEASESFLRLIPQNRSGIPDDIIGATLFLASNEASYITGQTIYIDGGWLAAGGNCIT